MGWSPEETLQQHKGWATHSHAHKAANHLFSEPLIKEDTMRGKGTQALKRNFAQHAEDPMQAGAYLQLEAVCRAMALTAHRKHLMLAHTERVSDPAAR